MSKGKPGIIKKRKQKKAQMQNKLKWKNQAPHLHMYCLSHYNLNKTLIFNQYRWV